VQAVKVQYIMVKTISIFTFYYVTISLWKGYTIQVQFTTIYIISCHKVM